MGRITTISCVLECGRVEEFMDSGIEERQNSVAERLGYEIRDHSMVLYGKCKRNPCPYRKKGRGGQEGSPTVRHHSRSPQSPGG